MDDKIYENDIMQNLYTDIVNGTYTTLALAIVFGMFLCIVVYISSIDK